MHILGKIQKMIQVMKEKDVLILHKENQIWLPYCIVKTLKYQFFSKKNIYIGSKTIINNPNNIEIINKGRLEVAISDFGIVSKLQSTYINMRLDSKINIDGIVSIGRGTNIGLASNANLKIGGNTFITGNSKIICTNSIVIGNDCAISWNVQILDNDFHKIIYNNETLNETSGIVIGNHVWICSNVTILKGVTIGKKCA